MPRSKKRKSSGPPNRRAARGSRLEPDFVPFAAVPLNGRQPALSLQEEALNTSGHAGDWWDQKLRNSKVNFVSAGTDRPSAIDPDAVAKMSLESPDTDQFDDEDEGHEDMADPESQATHSPMGQDPFIIDTKGTGPIDTGLPPPRIRSVSPTPSDSSEEVIMFRGRDSKGRVIIEDVPPRSSRRSTEALDRKIRIVEDKIQEKENLLKSVQAQEAEFIEGAEFIDVQSSSRRATRRDFRIRASRGKASRIAKKETEDELLADYIANMEAQEMDEVGEGFNNRDLGGSDNDAWVHESNESFTHEDDDKEKPVKGKSKYSWDKEDINDLDDLPTDDEVFSSIQEILCSRKRPAGTQYLVVWDDQIRDECRWVPSSTLLNIPGAAARIADFKAEEKLIAQFQDNAISDEDSEDDESGEDVDEDDEEDELSGEAMTDEQMARLLAKQEELGMGSDSLMLFNDTYDDEDDDTRYIIRELTKPRGKGRKRPRGEFPAASALADVYDGFDVMDCDRPSLSRKKAGKKGKGIPDLDLSDLDPDLAIELQLQYENDRNKKKRVKEERQELRALGLLGKGGKKGNPDMKAKYKEGINLAQLRDEIKDFLLSDSAQLGLPPMDKAQRKIVHEIANAFNLKSVSYGSGKSRYPMLVRTERTADYNEQLFQRFQDRLGRRFFPRMDAGSSSSKKRGGGGGAPKGRGGAGASNAAVTYRDGEVVGGSAPELGKENKGMAMLEKMGWSKGDALGALNNKGILQPVLHVVKTTKAGLG